MLPYTRAASFLVDAPALAGGKTNDESMLTAPETEVSRLLHICNDCHYCDSFCAVFPSSSRRLQFAKADIHYLANLCHNCGACLHGCEVAPPHELAVNLPQAMARVRGQTYADYAWPPALGALYQRHGLVLSLALAGALTIFLLLALALNGTLLGSPQAGYSAVFGHQMLVGLFAPVFLYAVLALGMGVRRFWHDVTPATSGQSVSAAAAGEAARDVLRLKYLDGGHGDGCNNADGTATLARRRAHHLTFYGVLLCLAATLAASVYHYVLGWTAPYDLPQLPKLLGVAGGLSLLLGTGSLFALNLQRHPLHGDAAQKPMDRGFIALLFCASASGLALWWVHAGVALPALLTLHLGLVMALFATLPYGKFAHGIFRTAALLRHAVEKRQT
ncbi:Citrate utilization protein B [Rhodoferax ferrireducens T118]|uniref:Citrate utilization protein B n=1 Tax=Albidiferax ferrireducens (strain ATCC BAA-621 / DSM 15236 / T118) TaxID=338969 RepID=Q221D2_ALBFT|nr:tricarballylate utilization 4Fe-4S protein TcuB [Rhodoferax ferrireducens]ABD68371.1 Citrate utilization protein B [Rhodoferax ferrireducens T118]